MLYTVGGILKTFPNYILRIERVSLSLNCRCRALLRPPAVQVYEPKSLNFTTGLKDVFSTFKETSAARRCDLW